MVLQHSSVGKSLLWHISYNNYFVQCCTKVGTFPPSYAVIPSFISCFTTFYCIGPFFIFNLTFLTKKKNTSYPTAAMDFGDICTRKLKGLWAKCVYISAELVV